MKLRKKNTLIKKQLVLLCGLLVSMNAYAIDGESIYKQTCIACHGEDGKGLLPGMPDLTEKQGRLSKDDAVLVKNMRDGYQSPGSPMAMPAKGGNSKLTDEDLKNVLQYMRKSF